MATSTRSTRQTKTTRPTIDPLQIMADGFTKGVKRSWNLTRHMMGIDRAQVGMTPRDAVWSRGKSVLYRYRSDDRSVRPPVLLVMSLVSRAYILDLQPGNSFVEHLLEEGFDVFLLDWGVPDEDDAGNTLETYVDDHLPDAVAVVDRMGEGHGVTVFGYCFGGLLALLYAAGHPEDPIRNLVVMATPVDFRHMPPAMSGVGDEGIDPDHVLDADGNVPAQYVRRGFSLLTPTADLATYADFWERLDDDKFLNSYQAMTGWTRNHIPFPGAAFKQTVELFNDGNGFINDQLVLSGRRIHLSDIEVPFLNVLAERDHIVPAAASLPLNELVGSTDKTQLALPAGHVGLIVGNGSRTRCRPAMSGWMKDHSTVADAASDGPPSAAAKKPTGRTGPKAKSEAKTASKTAAKPKPKARPRKASANAKPKPKATTRASAKANPKR